jgi:hypothetical protein
MQGQTAAQTIDSYLEGLAFPRNSFRLKSMYRDTHDDVLTDMNNELLFAYNAWHHNRMYGWHSVILLACKLHASKD